MIYFIKHFKESLIHYEDSLAPFMKGHTICHGEALEIASNRFLPLPNATKLCGTEGFLKLNLNDLLHLDRSFRKFYNRPVKVWTDWRRLNETYFYNGKTSFKVPATELCSDEKFQYSFFDTVAISRHEKRYVTVSEYFVYASLSLFRKIISTTL